MLMYALVSEEECLFLIKVGAAHKAESHHDHHNLQGETVP